MLNLFTPVWVKNILSETADKSETDVIRDLNKKLRELNCGNPEISVVIPVWNENRKIIPTLLSLAAQRTVRKFEIIVVNNNSSDNTQEILDLSGVKNFFEPVQGISFARQRGLEAAQGKYHLCADADSLYPPDWIDEMIKPLELETVSCVYGKYAFIPSGKLLRIGLVVFELTANTIFLLRKKRKEYLNVMGFNFGFRREDGLKIGGFNTSRQKWSDGWMGMKLMETGTLNRIARKKALVWTSPRRLEIDGGLIRSFFKRVKKEIKVLREYLVIGGYEWAKRQ